MRFTLLATPTQSYDSEGESCTSDESHSSLTLENDPLLLGNDMNFWSTELSRLGDELCKYGVADIFKENKKSSGKSKFNYSFSIFQFYISQRIHCNLSFKASFSGRNFETLSSCRESPFLGTL